MINTGEALFVGATTIDIHYLVHNFPLSNTKVKAGDFAIAVGGPATNAAITHAFLGGSSELWSVVGNNPFREFIQKELSNFRISHMDLGDEQDSYPGISSIITTEETGDRSVIYQTPKYTRLKDNYHDKLKRQKYDLVLIDGLLMDASLDIAKVAKKSRIPVVLDAGSWKEGTEELLASISIVIFSEDFHPPGTSNYFEVFSYLDAKKIPMMAVSRGNRSIVFQSREGKGEIPIKEVSVIDTLGAGDILHGAFCYHYLHGKNFIEALKKASEVATESCRYFGTRSWMNIYRT
jgi:sugar/nucleoside kinase (ribokinase family)